MPPKRTTRKQKAESPAEVFSPSKSSGDTGETENKNESLSKSPNTSAMKPVDKAEDTPEKTGTDNEEDLNYDEYDLAQECDMKITCKVCKNTYNSLEKFIAHKNTQCKERRSISKTNEKTVNVSVSLSTAEKAETAQTNADSPAAVSEVTALSDTTHIDVDTPRRSTRKRKPKNFDSPDEAERGIDLEIDPPVRTYAGKRKRVIREYQPPLEDKDVEFIDSTVPTSELQEEMKEDIPEKLNSEDEEAEDSESEGEDFNNFVKLTYKPTDEDEDMDIPVKLKSVATSSKFFLPQITRKRPVMPKPINTDMTSYTIVKLEKQEIGPEPRPTLQVTYEQLQKVRHICLSMPDSSGKECADTVAAIKLNEPANQRKKFLEEELTNPTMPPEPTSALGPLETVLATTSEGSAVKLFIRKVVKAYSKVIEKQDEEVEVVECDNVSANPGTSTGNTDTVSGIKSNKSDKGDEDDDVGSDEDENFDHDPSLYDYLKHDEQYTLAPKKHSRLSRFEIKNREDCNLDNLQCLTCGTTYSCMKTLINHMSYQHSDKKAFYPCIFCRNVYSQHKNVARHIQKTHNKTKDFVDKLRGFLRSQAFTRTYTNPEIDFDKLPEDFDPFALRVKEMRGTQHKTAYSSMSDKEILARYGRKIKSIGRPPGRPSKSSQRSVALTCTICNIELPNIKSMLNHLRVTHMFLQRQINKMRPKLQIRVAEFQAEERKKMNEVHVQSMIERQLAQKGVTAKRLAVDKYGRLATVKIPADMSVQSVSLSAVSPQKANSVAISYNPPMKRSNIVNVLTCGKCNRVFTNHLALNQHVCSALTSAHSVIASGAAVSSNQSLIVVPSSAEIISTPNTIISQQNVMEAMAPETVEISGLDTLAEISTNEANKNGAGRIEIQGGSRAINLGGNMVQLQRPITVATPTQQHQQQQVVTLTPEQLEALKKSGNVIYVVRQ